VFVSLYQEFNDFLKGKFGFTSQEFIKGSYESDQASYKITDKNFISKVMKYLQFEGNPDEVKGIFGNSQVLGGYAPEDGFRMFYMTERWPVCEEVREIFLAQGSGRDTCDLVYSRFADTRKLTERMGRNTIPRSSGLYTLLKGLNTAMNLTAGVGGYPKIIYIDAKRSNRAEWISEICDMRSRLAAEIVTVAEEGFITVNSAENLLEDLIFKGLSFEKINQVLFNSVKDPVKLLHFLRGYAV